MKLAMMTLGCPSWDLETICRRAHEYGFDGVDFRGLLADVDVTKLPAFTTHASKTAKLLADHGLEVSGISSSISVCNLERRADWIAEARRAINAANGVGAKNVRVFGGGDAARIGYPEAAKIGRDCIQEILNIPGARDLSWNFETHDAWIQSSDCKLLLDSIPDSSFGACWDLGHTRRVGGETAEQTVATLGNRIRYAHIKDAVKDKSHANADKDGWRYVLPGTGELSLSHAVQVLKASGFDGWLMFEHEKRWHPELEEPEIAFPAFVMWAASVLPGK